MYYKTTDSVSEGNMSLEVLLVFVFVLNVLFHFNNFTYSFEDPQEMQVLYQMFLLNSGEFDK